METHLSIFWREQLLYLVTAFKVSSYKVKDCTKLRYYCIEKGNYYLYEEILSENVVKAAGVSGVKVQKLPYPLDGPIYNRV